MAFTPPGIALALQAAVALAVLRVRTPVRSPVTGMAFAPSALCPRLVIVILGVSLATPQLPASSSLSLTAWRCAETLLGRLRTRMEWLATASALRALHGRVSSEEPSTSVGDKPTANKSAAPPRERGDRRIQLTGSIP